MTERYGRVAILLHWIIAALSGLFDVPKLPVGQGAPLASAAAAGHDAMGWTMAALALLHVGAALRHRFLLRDAILARMIP